MGCYPNNLNLDSFMECDSIAASTEEILWSDDDTIIADQEIIWQQGTRKFQETHFPSTSNITKIVITLYDRGDAFFRMGLVRACLQAPDKGNCRRADVRTSPLLKRPLLRQRGYVGKS
ncbi:hypothetical protein FQA39_LY05325 [Lamprigera yunnana]|nr:hypothetical protein FQA39_LY05325 [Lamprigera yunnana]